MLWTGSLSFPLNAKNEKYDRLLACAGAAMAAECASIPFETIKVRVQMKDELQPYRRGALSYVARNLSHESTTRVAAFYKGLSVGLLRQLIGAPLRMGIYAEMKKNPNFQNGAGEMTWGWRLLAGSVSTVATHAAMNPLSFLKIRMQVNGPNQFPRYHSSLDAVRKIWAKEGAQAFYSGFSANLVRNSSLHVTELMVYDFIKEHALDVGVEDSALLHSAAGAGAGLTAALVCNPFDVLKTRLMCQKSFNIRKYNDTSDAIRKIFKAEGVSGFYKGVYPQLVRLATWNMVMFTTYEHLIQFQQERRANE
jgi:hypothetical protein